MKTEIQKDFVYGFVVFTVTLVVLGFIAQTYLTPSFKIRSSLNESMTNHDSYSTMAKLVVGTNGTDPRSGCGCPMCCAAANS